MTEASRRTMTMVAFVRLYEGLGFTGKVDLSRIGYGVICAFQPDLHE